MRYGLALLISVLSVVPAVAQTAATTRAEDPEPALSARVVEAITAVKAKDAAKALAIVEPVLAGYEALYPASKGAVRCTNDEAVVGTKQSGVAMIPNGWCFALWVKGYSLVELARVPEAVAPLQRAATLMPDNPQFHSELGYVHQALRQWDESTAAYSRAADEAVRIGSEDDRNFQLRRAWFGIGFNLVELGRYDEAESYFKKCLEVAPGDKKVLDELEYIREARGKAKTS